VAIACPNTYYTVCNVALLLPNTPREKANRKLQITQETLKEQSGEGQFKGNRFPKLKAD
jgi:hypothetical protein